MVLSCRIAVLLRNFPVETKSVSVTTNKCSLAIYGWFLWIGILRVGDWDSEQNLGRKETAVRQHHTLVVSD